MTTLLPLLIIAALATLVATAAVGIGAALVVIARRAPATEPMIAATAGDAPTSAARITLAMLTVATVMLAASLVLRAIVAGHAPWSNLHEFSLAFATGLLVAYLLLARTYPIGGLAPLVALLAVGLVGFALSLDDRVDPLVPALQQPLLLTIHVGTAAAAYAVAGVAFLAAAAEIAQRWAGDRMAGLPDAATLRVVGHRAVLIAFPILTIAIALGSVWANLAWRSYWSNDPKELAAAATWLVFGAYLHVAGRRDRWEPLAPWLIVIGFAGVLFTYIGAGLFIVGEHSYGAP
ncbi:MAG TPA: cytochrome c biogenesis protein CcsA [Candidatus Limnocylindria bacterium]